MTGANRLPAPYGLLIDREQALRFEFENQTYSGLRGDTIASALAANGQWLLSRSFKYHRPRGALTMAGQDANTLVQLPAAGNTLADREPISAGLQVMGQNYSGSLQRDLHSWQGWFARFMPVGFYYKAFFKPRGIWEKWAPLIRRRTGLGVIDTAHVPGYHDKQYKFCDIAVIGAGPAGLQAALDAARTGAEVLLVDENPVLGGSLTYARFDSEGKQAASLRQSLCEQVAHQANIEVMTDAVCNGWFADNWLGIIRGQRLYKVRCREVIMCVGAMEQPAVFRNNDLPGIMLGSAAQRLLQHYAVAPGRTAVVLAGNNDAYAVALDLLDAGLTVTAIIELRENPRYDAVAQAAVARGVTVKKGWAVYRAKAGAGGKHLAGVEVRKILSPGACAGDGEYLACDLLCMSVGYTPTYQLVCQAGAKLGYVDESSTFTLDNFPPGFQIAGSVNGTWSLGAVLAEARRCAILACNGLGFGAQEVPPPVRDTKAASANFDWPIFPHPAGKEFVDFDEDLQIADILNSVAEGYEHVQLVKRYSTCGMGPSQGRHSALTTARLIAAATHKSVAATGVTTARPPFAPETLAHNAGRSFYPARRSNMHHRHLEAGAQMLQAGDWYRPAFYGPAQEREQCIHREVEHVRQRVGIVDVSTLGGIEVRGGDAAEFMNRFYTWGFIKQAVGRARYALLTNEAGVVTDDGVACRLHDHHFYVTTTTGAAGQVFQGMLKWNAQWRLDVDIANVTTAWCGVNVAGPGARQVLEKVRTDVALEAAEFPYMGVREGMVAGIEARLIRVGFVGELGYEIHVPQQCGEALWDALLLAGEAAGIRPFGIEAQRLLRLEKGHAIVGQDTDAMSNPMELQMGWAVARQKPFFVGGRTLAELDKVPLQRILAGFVLANAGDPTPLESHLVLDGNTMVGRVTSCAYSPTVGKVIGLAHVPVALGEPGGNISIKTSTGKRVSAHIVALPFYDPDNRRQEL